MAKSKKLTREEKRERDLKSRQVVAEHPKTRELFVRADVEPYVLSLEAASTGIRIEFQGLHPAHALQMLDVLGRMRATPAEQQETW